MTETDRINPYTLEIIKSSLTAIGDEMFSALRRTSMSPIIYETLDYSVGVTDRTGDLIAQGNGTTVFLGMIDSLVKEVLAKFGPGDDIHPGDMFISNDPYQGGGTHLSDVALVKPVFYRDELVGFTVNKAHWVDVGGKVPGSFTPDSTEIFQEGIQIPAVKVITGGEPVAGVLDILQANIRLPQDSMGDFWAGVAANNVGEARLLRLFEKYGRDAVFLAMEELLDYGERMIAIELKKLPRGTFYAEDWIDDDGLGDEPLKVCARIDISEDSFKVDFTGTAPQALGPINHSRTGLVSAVRTIFKALTNPQVPANSGCFRAIEIICPDETLFTAKRPAPTSIYWETMLYVEDLVWQALAEHMPDRLPAGHVLSVCANILSGVHPETNEPIILVQPLVGGWGAMHDRDGQNGQFSVADGETYNIPIEIIESRYGVHVDRYQFHNEDGGAGKFRGGKGLYFDIRIRSDNEAYFTGSFGRSRFPPWGVDSGRKGSSNYVEIIRAGKRDRQSEIYAKPSRVPLRKGDVVRMVTATGGGWGDPKLRPRDKVLEDIKNGYITAYQAAQEHDISSQ